MLIKEKVITGGFDIIGRKRAPRRILELRCDHCGLIFERPRVLRDVRRSYHYDKPACRYAAMRTGGKQNAVLRATNNARYGVDYPSQNSKIRDKAIKTWKEKLGADNPAKSRVVQERMEKTSLERYGVRYPIAADSVKQKIKEACLRRYGTVSPASSAYIVGKYDSKKAGIIHYRSSYERKAYNILDADESVCFYSVESLSISYKLEDKELLYFPDILVSFFEPSKKLIEVKPKRLMFSPACVAKHSAAREYCKQNNITFEIWTEDELF